MFDTHLSANVPTIYRSSNEFAEKTLYEVKISTKDSIWCQFQYRNIMRRVVQSCSDKKLVSFVELAFVLCVQRLIIMISIYRSKYMLAKLIP